MANCRLLIENQTSQTMHFHVEPECEPFEVPVEKVAEITCFDENEPVTIQFSDDPDGVLGAVFPGEGGLIVRIDGNETIVSK